MAVTHSEFSGCLILVWTNTVLRYEHLAPDWVQNEQDGRLESHLVFLATFCSVVYTSN